MAAVILDASSATPWFVDFPPSEYEETYIKNVKPTKRIATSEFVLPDGWPKSVDSGFAWDGADLKHKIYVFELSQSDNMIILQALQSFKGKVSATYRDCYLYSPLVQTGGLTAIKSTDPNSHYLASILALMSWPSLYISARAWQSFVD